VSAVAVSQSAVDARGRLRRTVAPPPAAWPADHAALYRAFLRWLDPHGVPAARERTTLVAVRHLLASVPGPVEPATLATAVSTLLADYAHRGAAPGTLQQYGSALRLFRRFVAIQCGLPPAVSPSPTPERYLAPLPPWMHPRLLEYIMVQSRGWRPEARCPRTHALAAHFTRVLSFLHRAAPMTAWSDLLRRPSRPGSITGSRPAENHGPSPATSCSCAASTPSSLRARRSRAHRSNGRSGFGSRICCHASSPMMRSRS
jgi:hypothetical protein